MFDYIISNLGTIIVSLILLIIVVLAVRSIINGKKKGQCSCGGNCSSCAMGGTCHSKGTHNK